MIRKTTFTGTADGATTITVPVAPGSTMAISKAQNYDTARLGYVQTDEAIDSEANTLTITVLSNSSGSIGPLGAGYHVDIVYIVQ